MLRRLLQKNYIIILEKIVLTFIFPTHVYLETSKCTKLLHSQNKKKKNAFETFFK